jgi:hypothetical protein
MTTNPKNYKVTPNSGFIPVEESRKVEIIAKEVPLKEYFNDKFLIRAVSSNIPMSAEEFAKLLKTEPKNLKTLKFSVNFNLNQVNQNDSVSTATKVTNKEILDSFEHVKNLKPVSEETYQKMPQEVKKYQYDKQNLDKAFSKESENQNLTGHNVRSQIFKKISCYYPECDQEIKSMCTSCKSTAYFCSNHSWTHHHETSHDFQLITPEYLNIILNKTLRVRIKELIMEISRDTTDIINALKQSSFKAINNLKKSNQHLKSLSELKIVQFDREKVSRLVEEARFLYEDLKVSIEDENKSDFKEKINMNSMPINDLKPNVCEKDEKSQELLENVEKNSFLKDHQLTLPDILSETKLKC